MLTARAADRPQAAFPLPRRKKTPPDWFQPIAPSTEDRLIVPNGFQVDIVIRWGDPLGSLDPQQRPEQFGFNNDFIAFFPIDARSGKKDLATEEALLWVNHEYPNPLFLSGYTPADYLANRPKTAEQIRLERLSVGGSVVQIKRTAGVWKPVVPSPFNRRFTADYPVIPLTGPAATKVPQAVGTLANCSGGRTPWFTALSCEENYPDFNAYDPKDYFFRWGDVPELKIDEKQYGWVVEVDPFGELPPRKHSALGRFKHENAAITTGATGKLVVYMGDDEVDQHLYKFVSEKTFDRTLPRAEQRKVLESGTLYAADFAKGKWLPLVYDSKITQAALKKAGLDSKIQSQADVLIETRAVAKALGATPLDRCEDCEVHPRDGSLYVALTNNTKHGNLYGHLVRLVEDGDDAESTTFRYEIFLAGGPQSGLACPDNLAFDRHGNLWVVCDMSSGKINKGAYKPFGNNGLYVVPTLGDSTGDAFQFASGPVQCELTGPFFSDDGSTLFLSVQHPGEESLSLEHPTSHWPDGGNAMPRPAVVAIRGFPG